MTKETIAMILLAISYLCLAWLIGRLIYELTKKKSVNKPSHNMEIIDAPKALTTKKQKAKYEIKGFAHCSKASHLYHDAFKRMNIPMVGSKRWPNVTNALTNELVYKREVDKSEMKAIRQIQLRLHEYHMRDIRDLNKKYNVYQELNGDRILISGKEDVQYVY